MAVAHAYFDTSVLVKRFVDERGSARARALSRRYRFLSSAIAPAEATSAVSRRRAAGDLSEPDVADILERMARERRTWELVAITSLVLSRAEELIRYHTLRTLDAVHVASALIFQTDTGSHVPFVTADARQREAAGRVNLEVVWVG